MTTLLYSNIHTLSNTYIHVYYVMCVRVCVCVCVCVCALYTVRRETLAVGKFGEFTTKTHLAKENLANLPFEIRVKIFTT